MESFLNTEIARLVYGYLVEESCQSAASLFLENSVHMHECLSVVRKGRRFSTKKCGKTLVEILEILADVTSLVRNFSENRESDLEEFMQNLVGLLIFVDEAQTVPRKLRKDDLSGEQKSNYINCLNTEKDPEQCKSPIQDLENSEDEYDIQNRPGLQVLLEKKEWHERLAENINKAVGSGNETSEPEKLALEKVLEKKTVETIVNTFEADPIFEEILKELVGPVSRSSPSNADDTEQEGEEIPIANEANLEIPAAKNVQQETIPVLNNQTNFQNEKDETKSHLGGGFFVMGQNVESSTSQQQHNFTSSIQTSPQSSLTLIPIVKHAQLEKPLSSKSPVLKLTPTTTSGPPQSAQIVIQTSPALQPGATTFQMSAPKSPQVVSIISTSGSPLLKDSISTVSPIPCSVISRFEVVGPKVFFKKDPNSLPFHSKIHIQGETPPRPRLDILPKMEPLKVQIEDCTQMTPSAEVLQGDSDISREPVVIKRSGVRTRGGKRGGRKPQTRLKAIAPNLPKMENPLQLLIVSNDQQPKLPTVSTVDQLINRPTTLSCHTIQKSDAAPVVASCEKESSESTCNEIPPSVENPQPTGQEGFEKKTTMPKLSVPQEEESKVTEECTPEQTNSSTVNFKERLSLSSPRRGSHVRTLEFNTPPKGINMRKANTSPKNSAKNKHITQRLLKNFRRGGLFNSPSPNKSQENVQNTESQAQCQVGQTVKSKKPNAWDSDLRVYIENEDIPTSVGLQRKKPANGKGKDKLICVDKVSDKTDKSTSSNSVLCSIEEEDLNESSRCENTSLKSNTSTLEKEKSQEQSELSHVGQADVDFLNAHSANSNAVKSKNILNDDNSCHMPSDCLSPTNQLSLKNNPSLLASCTKSPGSSLESTLIKECARIENLNKVLSENEESNKANEKPHTFATPFKIEQDIKITSNEMYKFQTPAKTLLTPNSKQIVEMTPISQIRWEINELDKTKLVTPTLPQTPKDEIHLDQEVSPPSDKMSDISKESPVKVTKAKPKTVAKKTQKTKVQKKSSPILPMVTVELNAKTKFKRSTRNINSQEKDFDVEKTIKKCLKQAKNIIYGKDKVVPCNLSTEIKEDDKPSGIKTRSKKPQKVGRKSPTGIPDNSISENVNISEPAKLPQLKDSELAPKNITRQIDIVDEESGGSFPHLYLSEDEVTPADNIQRNSNAQVISESFAGKKNSQVPPNEKSSPHPPSIDKKVTRETPEMILKENKHLVDNKNDNSVSIKNNLLEDFKYTFSVIDEDSGEYVSKNLKISPFLDLFELAPSNENRPSKYFNENKNKTKEEEITTSKSSHQKEHIDSNKKQEKRSFNFEPSSDTDKRRRVHSSCSSNEDFDPQRRKRQCLNRASYKEAYSQSARRKGNDRHFRERTRYSRRREKTPFSARRSRYSRDVESSRKHNKSWSDERNDYRRKKSFISPYKGISSDSHKKDNFEEDGVYNKAKDGWKTKSKYPENRRSEKEDLLQMKSKEIQEIINQNKELNRRLQELEGNNKAHKQNASCKEEGELSDTSCSVSPRRKKPDSIFSNKKLSLVHSSLVAEDCRTTLLKELDVDSFLSIVHGSDENKPI